MGITYLLHQAKEAGDLPAHLDSEDIARFIMSSCQGARKKWRTEARATRDAARQYLASWPLRDATAFRAFGRAEVKAGRDVRIALGLLILGPAIGMVGAMRIDARQR
jgi:hypothetical protein